MAETRAPRVPPPLHELETEIMDEVWGRDSSTVNDIMGVLNGRAREPRAYTTYMTVMRRLNDKGLLDRRRQGRFDVYTPTLTREQYLETRARAEVTQLVSDYGETALVHFARELDDVDPDRRRALRRLARRG